MSDSLRCHGLQHARLPCLLPTLAACSNSCPLSLWCHPNISSSVITFSSCLQSFPASGSFSVSQFFTSGGQSIGILVVLDYTSIPKYSNEHSGLISFRIDWFDLAVQRTLQNLFQHHSSKTSILQRSAFFYRPTLTSIHDYWKNHSSD